MTIPETLNLEFIDRQYEKWRADPGSVSRDWRHFFQGFRFAAGDAGPAPEAPGKPAAAPAPAPETAGDRAGAIRQSRAEALIHRYRDIGHLLACLDPLSACPTGHPLLDLSAFDLTEADLDAEVHAGSLADGEWRPLGEILQGLRETYCRSVGVEFMHLQDPSERGWLIERMEPVRNAPELEAGDRLRILRKLHHAALFEGFLNRKYVGQTRFSLEGADVIVPLLDAVFRRAAEEGCREAILGMAHRGRLNVQTNVLGRPYEDIFSQFEHCYDADNLVGSGDVKYHNGYLNDVAFPGDKKIRVYLVDNPSHLESVDPVVEGVARARQDAVGEKGRRRVLPVLLHGDAAFAGQGLVAETLNLSQLAGYRTGGTIHVIINNQIGYTTLPEDARSTRYSTDVAKMLMVPIFHVHGESPDAVIHAARLAADYRTRFGKDVVIDVICYRRYGHNEGDEPYFTQPLLYERIKDRPSVHATYGERLREEGLVSDQELEALDKEINDALSSAFEEIKGSACAFPFSSFYEQWEGIADRYDPEPPKTAVSGDRIESLAASLNTPPEDFEIHRKLSLVLKRRRESVDKGEGIDWANAEALAFGSLLTEGVPVRLSGQDSRRGTFSQRHAALAETRTGKTHVPLNHLSKDQAPFYGIDSLLAEAGVLGFEYGYSLVTPGGLTLWEAQFGDFVNNAQAVIDLYIASGKAKWRRDSGLVMLLPHGLEGLGPEHSSARPERFLQLCADNNMLVCNLTTPAQYFHCLRRQVRAPYRLPLIVMAPKSLLRHPRAVSKVAEFTDDRFRPVLDDSASLEDPPYRVIFCSGKIYYDLLQRREELKAFDIGIIRVEQLYPFPRAEIEAVMNRYRDAKQWCWVQEEPANMGAWNFVWQRLEILAEAPFRYIGRKTSASPATGFPKVYRREQAAIIEEAIGPPAKEAQATDRYHGG